MKNQKIKTIKILVLVFVGVFSSCKPYQAEEAEVKTEMQPKITKAVCVLYPTEGNTANGTVVFTQANNGIQVSVDMNGLSEGKHGFHVHQYGDCSAPDGTSAGGHFNPEHMPHSSPQSAKRHVGDLGNIVANAEGMAQVEFTDTVLTFYGKNSIIGRGIIVHAGEDDLNSQPTGNAGSRVACGVIGIAQ